jgi:hypothetical protein
MKYRILGIILGICGLFLILLALSVSSKNVAAYEHTCPYDGNGAENQWYCELYTGNAVQATADYVKYRNSPNNNYYLVSDREYTGWIALDKENFKAMTEYSYNDPGGGNGLTLEVGWVGSRSYDTGCDEWHMVWKGNYNGKDFLWRQQVMVCDNSMGPAYFFFNDMIWYQFHDSTWTTYTVQAHKGIMHVKDTTNKAYVYKLRQSGWDETRNELTVYGMNGDPNNNGGKVKITDPESTAVVWVVPDSTYTSVVNIDKYPGYSDSTPYFANNDEDSQGVMSEIWATVGGNFAQGSGFWSASNKYLIGSNWPN